MIVSHEHRFIFVRPRKVASTSVLLLLARSCGKDDQIGVTEVFDPCVDSDYFDPIGMRNFHPSDREGGHVLPGAIRELVGARVWEGYFKFTILRNPFDLVVSYIYYKCGPDWPGVLGHNRLRLLDPRYALRRLEACLARQVFESGRHKEGVERILKKGIFPYIREVPEFYFLDGQEYADYYIRYENLQNDYDEVCRLLQIPSKTLSRTKDKTREKGADYHDYYTDWSREYVGKLCRKMIINWYPDILDLPPPQPPFSTPALYPRLR